MTSLSMMGYAGSDTTVMLRNQQRGCQCCPGSQRYGAGMPTYRLVDMAGSELGIVADERAAIALGDRVALPDGSTAPVVDVYDDEDGKEGGVQATLAVDDGS